MPTQPNKNLKLAREVMQWKEFTEANFKTHVIFIDGDGLQRYVRKDENLAVDGLFGKEFNPTDNLGDAMEVFEMLIGTPIIAVSIASDSKSKKVTATLENVTLGQTFTDTRSVQNMAWAIANVAAENVDASSGGLQAPK